MFTIIVAVGKNNEIGKNNNLIWHIPNDLKFFKQVTQNSKIVMGRKTFQSLPKRLMNREYFIITKNVDFVIDYATTITNIDAFIEENKDTKEEIFIIGGASIYNMFLPYVRKMYITQIYKSDEMADTYFPNFNKEEWNKSVISKNIQNEIEYEHLIYERK